MLRLRFNHAVNCVSNRRSQISFLKSTGERQNTEQIRPIQWHSRDGERIQKIRISSGGKPPAIERSLMGPQSPDSVCNFGCCPHWASIGRFTDAGDWEGIAACVYVLSGLSPRFWRSMARQNSVSRFGSQPFASPEDSSRFSGLLND